MLNNQNLEETIQQLQTSGMLFCIEYVGSVIVEKSINSLSAARQAEVARDCMRFVIEKALPSLEIAKSETSSSTSQYVQGPVQSHKRDVELNISSSAIILIDSDSMRPLHRFRIQDVSLLSPGFDELSSFFCFFAKVPGQPTSQWVRKCFVFNANSEMKDVRDTICFAFRLNEHSHGRKSSDDHSSSAPIDCINRDETATPIPPATPPTPVCRELASPGASSPCIPEIRVIDREWLPEVPPRPRRYTSGNSSNGQEVRGRSSANAGGLVPSTGRSSSRSSSISPRDDISVQQMSPTRLMELTRGLDQQSWFHGVLPRLAADTFICKNGQFLVRQSPNIEGQFVLVGMHDDRVRHVCLLSKEGKIQTTIGEFRSIVHLINYFHGSRHPLMLHGEQLVLHYPIARQT